MTQISQSNTLINSVIGMSLTPSLKKLGFRKRGLTWNKADGENTLVFNLQLSKFKDDDKLPFTINLGTFYPDIWSRVWSQDVPQFVMEEDCFPRTRIGWLLENKQRRFTDHWWIIETKSNPTLVGSELIAALENLCLPFFSDSIHKDIIYDWYKAEKLQLFPIEKIYMALISFDLGDADLCTKLMNEVSNISASWKQRVENVELVKHHM